MKKEKGNIDCVSCIRRRGRLRRMSGVVRALCCPAHRRPLSRVVPQSRIIRVFEPKNVTKTQNCFLIEVGRFSEMRMCIWGEMGPL